MEKYFVISGLDYLLSLVYSILLILLSFIYFSLTKNKQPWVYYLGLIARIVSSYFFLLIYIYFYNYTGDTFGYIYNGYLIKEVLIQNPIIGFKILIQPANTFNSDTFLYTSQIPFFQWENANLVVAKITSLIHIISFDNPLTSTILFSFLSYIGIYRFYLTLIKLYPSINSKIAIAILFIPSVVFWGSGIMKDTLVIGFLGILLSSILNLVYQKNRKTLNWIFSIISIFIISLIKAYVIVALGPALLLFYSISRRERIKNIVVKKVITPLVVLVGLGIAGYSFISLGEYFPDYSIENFAKTASVYQQHHFKGEESTEAGTRSGYTLGSFEPTFFGILQKAPSAVNVTLFRPYLWEAKNIVMLFAAFESLFVLILSIRILLRNGIKNVFQYLYKDPFIFSCLFFTIIFAFAVGFSSYNFGALVRYKIPCIQLFVLCLFVIDSQSKRKIKVI